MERTFSAAMVAVLLVGAAFGQDSAKPPVFEVADVRAMPPIPFMSGRADSAMSGGLIPGGRYELHGASMDELIRTAYGLDSYEVFGGPPWLETDHFQLIAKTAASASPADLKLMLQALLADRFKLVTHRAKEEMDVVAFTVAKPGLMKESEEAQGGCKFSNSTGLVTVECTHMAMADFVKQLGWWASNGTRPGVDLTGLKGQYDFTLKWSMPMGGPGAIREADAGPHIPFTEAIEKQLGLKAVEQKYPMPVLVIDSVNHTPTPNAPGVEKILGLPTEFEAASVKPSRPGDVNRKFQITRGRLDVENIPLKALIAMSQNQFPIMAAGQSASEFEQTFERETIIGGPKWIETQCFDIAAKMNDASPYAPGFLPDHMGVMLRALLADRFKLVMHIEQRPVPVWALVVGKGGPKLTPADPKSRSGCKPSGGEVRSGPDFMPVQIQTCHNVTMVQLADSLHAMARAFVDRAAVDMTGLKGGYDFTLTWNGIGVFNAMNARGAKSQATGGAVPEASDAHGISMFDAVEKLGLKLESGRKAPQPVVVIDHVEPLTEDN